jgi:hypothetical protein
MNQEMDIKAMNAKIEAIRVEALALQQESGLMLQSLRDNFCSSLQDYHLV